MDLSLLRLDYPRNGVCPLSHFPTGSVPLFPGPDRQSLDLPLCALKPQSDLSIPASRTDEPELEALPHKGACPLFHFQQGLSPFLARLEGAGNFGVPEWFGWGVRVGFWACGRAGTGGMFMPRKRVCPPFLAQSDLSPFPASRADESRTRIPARATGSVPFSHFPPGGLNLESDLSPF
jgi:hypothetical protein